jgi:hypothetical protein
MIDGPYSIKFKGRVSDLLTAV